ncbi:arginine deiminase-related protein [Flavobacteriales bacterium]|nr:arginine deiminase-related protein [Flavobacteriales bacterium]
MNRQLTNTVMMIRPVKFNYNAETAIDNKYQSKKTTLTLEEISEKATCEFNSFIRLLNAYDINVIELFDIEKNNTPDSIFPNNWISTHVEGLIHLYPMCASNRRVERRSDIIDFLKKNYLVQKVINQAEFNEGNNMFLEGTGSMVLDRENKIAYACISKRTSEILFNSWCQSMNYVPIAFCAKDGGQDIYHTNVVMSVCEDFVVICLDAIVNDSDKKKLLSSFKQTNKEVIPISIKQMNSFLGNVLQLINNKKESFLVMSSSAFNALDLKQKETIVKKTKILHSSLQTIEYFGGGSARCMLAEVFLSPRII